MQIRSKYFSKIIFSFNKLSLSRKVKFKKSFFKDIEINKHYNKKILLISNNNYFKYSIKDLLLKKSARNELPQEFIEKVFETLPNKAIKIPFKDYSSLLSTKIYGPKSIFFSFVLNLIRVFPKILNKLHNYFNIKLFWGYLLKNRSGILINYKNTTIRIPPIGSVICERLTGSIISNIYYTKEVLICPIYQGSLNQNNGIIFFDFKTHYFYILATEKVYYFFKEDQKKLDDFINSIIFCISKINSNKLKHLVYIGGKINYGHTIINDSSSINYFTDQKYKNIRFLIGNYDFLCSKKIYKNLNKNQQNISKKFIPINYYKIEKNIYSLPNLFITPLPSYRVSSKILSIISYPYKNTNNNTNNNKKDKSFYLMLDQREGIRKVKNWKDFAETLSAILKDFEIQNILIDGLTSIPQYSFKGEKTRKYALDKYFIKSLSRIFKRYEISSTIIDGLTFEKKNKICNKFNIISSFSSYGSGMHYPIYILNIPIAISGADRIFDVKTIKNWRWIHSKYCHKKRFYDEEFIPSSNGDQNGYTIDLNYFQNYLLKHLKNIL